MKDQKDVVAFALKLSLQEKFDELAKPIKDADFQASSEVRNLKITIDDLQRTINQQSKVIDAQSSFIKEMKAEIAEAIEKKDSVPAPQEAPKPKRPAKPGIPIEDKIADKIMQEIRKDASIGPLDFIPSKYRAWAFVGILLVGLIVGFVAGKSA